MKCLFAIDKILISKFLKFGVVGCSGMIIDFGMTYLCKEILRTVKSTDASVLRNDFTMAVSIASSPALANP